MSSQSISNRPTLAACTNSSIASASGQADDAAVLDGIDAKEIVVVGGTDEAFELRENIRCPASCRSERAEALAQETLVDRRRDTHLMHPTWRADYDIVSGIRACEGRYERRRKRCPSPRWDLEFEAPLLHQRVGCETR